jgi:hypothetical protein
MVAPFRSRTRCCINCRALAIAESGLFKGSTSIEDAEVRGRFEGDLTVRASGC